MANLDLENISLEDLEAASDIYDQLTAGTFYENQEKAIREMGGMVRYIGGDHE